MESSTQLLKIADLDSIKVMIETKCKELKLTEKTFHSDGQQETKAVKRAMEDLVGILLGYVDEQDAIELFKNQYGDKAFQKKDESENEQETNQESPFEQVIRQLTAQVKEVQFGMKTLVVQNAELQKKSEQVEPQQQEQEDLLKTIPESLAQLSESLKQVLDQQKKDTVQLDQDPNVKGGSPQSKTQEQSQLTDKIDKCLRILTSLQDNSQSTEHSLKTHMSSLSEQTDSKLGEIQASVDKMGKELNQQFESVMMKQQENQELIKQSTTLVEKIEQKSEIPQTIYVPQMMQQMKGQDQDAQYELHSQVAQNIFDRKIESSYYTQQAKFKLSGKYSFAVMTQQDYVFVDGNNNNVDVLKKDDLSLIGSLQTDNNAVFSFSMQGLKLFVGCANNNLFVYEVDTLKRIKDLKSQSIVYCFYQLDYNTLLCGQRDGHIQILQSNNLGKFFTFTMPNTSHIIQIGKTFKQGEIVMACSRGLFFAEVMDLIDYKVQLTGECYFKEQDIKGAIEFKRDMVACCIDMDLNIYIIDRKQKACVKTIENPSGSDRPLSMRLMPSFDNEKMPFLMIRDQEGITIVNVKNASAYKIFQCWYHQLPFPQMLLDCFKQLDTGAVICYLIEYTGKDSYLVKYELTGDFIGGLKIMAKNDM